MSFGLILLLLAAAVLVWIAWTFNRLVGLRNRMRAAWADVDALLKRRAELIPNLVAAVRGYMGHEQRVLEGVTEARAGAVGTGAGPENAAARAEAESVVTRRLERLIAVVEAYPDLRASVTFLSLQGELTRTENDLASARRYYNAVVRDLNTLRETFPTLLVAGILGFPPAELFELDEPGERAAPAADVRPETP
jgi:LemA protein